MAGMYAAYHGPKGIEAIAKRVHSMARALNNSLKKIGFTQQNDYFFDTLSIDVNKTQKAAIKKADELRDSSARMRDSMIKTEEQKQSFKDEAAALESELGF